MKVFIALIAVLSATAVGALQNDSEVVRELTDGTFESYLTVSNLAIVDFFAPWWVLYILLKIFKLLLSFLKNSESLTSKSWPLAKVNFINLL